jgi:hypothetical protein
MLTMIYMTCIQNMPFFLLKVNNPSVRHPVWPVGHSIWPRRAPPLAPIGYPVRPRLALRLATPSGHPIWPTVGHPVWRLATHRATRLAPRPAAVGSKKNKNKK